ncbi:LacI family DNA-binding transcriptional regulator [Spirilliplanes yamanashiensis]|uniref:LacI family transcriptional regulator n=1 Tax=Spirilliplanes yamanashiensis TaxID=42233 RepID=A0A8J3Y3S0_9ACTN|nr:LacI family DNA-binding transcriptional regulator [Spirilliplanes yamanashiensis]MDP9820034.1 LacI family transcriptional regulator [Spirilliplanes yamanashiensis]GIJ01146.1 LacI family transcriptional regulator [Spirilliplanes yamanashiensis]
MATIYDVARRAEVSPATVSRVVNGRANVDPALAERVRAAMVDLNYRPNAVARNLRRSRTSMWAVIISDIGNPFFTSLVRGVEDVAQTAGYSVVLCNSDNDEAKEGQYVNAALTEQMAGVIISPTAGSPHVARLLDAGVPVVVIDRQMAGADVDTVLVDNEQGARDATGHLAAAGYRRIACITGPRGLFTAERRLAGYRAALDDAGLAHDPALVRHADFGVDGGHAAMHSLLAVDPRPDAVFVGNNLMTIGAVGRIFDEGVTVPEEMGVVGFDDVPWATLMRPALTTVAQPTYSVGRNAAELLTDRITDPKRPVSTVTLPTELRVRGSSGAKP